MNSRRLMGVYPRPTDHGLGIAGLEWISGCASQQKAVPLVRDGSIATDEVEVTRSRMSASPLKADNLHTISASPLSAKSRHSALRQRTSLFDHLVGAI